MLVYLGFNYLRVHPCSFPLKNDDNIDRSIDSIDLPTSEYKDGSIQSKDHNALAINKESW